MYNYYQDRISQLEAIRSSIKHNAPEDVDLENIRSFLGQVSSDLLVLALLKRPDMYKLKRLESGFTQVIIKMNLDNEGAEELVKNLWLEVEP